MSAERDDTRERFYARHRAHMQECPDCGWWFCGLLACNCRTSRVYAAHVKGAR